MATGKATRRAVLVVGGLALLTRFWKDPSHHADASAQAHPVAVHPTPARSAPSASPHPPATPHSAPARARLARARPHQARRGHPDQPVFHIHDGRKRIALTIDDGPSPEYTPQVLRLLEKYRVTATFSMIGLEVYAYPHLVREVEAAGHKIANHTWSHLNLAHLPRPRSPTRSAAPPARSTMRPDGSRLCSARPTAPGPRPSWGSAHRPG